MRTSWALGGRESSSTQPRCGPGARMQLIHENERGSQHVYEHHPRIPSMQMVCAQEPWRSPRAVQLTAGMTWAGFGDPCDGRRYARLLD